MSGTDKCGDCGKLRSEPGVPAICAAWHSATDEDKAPLRPGDWVEVYGQVAAAERVHPEDVAVELFSHSDQYLASVRRDRVRQIAPPRGVAYPCTSLYKTPQARNDALILCRLHERHADKHQATDSDGAPWTWTDEQSVGNVDPR